MGFGKLSHIRLLYRDRISDVERNEVDYFGRITQVERTEIEFGRTCRVKICYPVSRIVRALRNPAFFGEATNSIIDSRYVSEIFAIRFTRSFSGIFTCRPEDVPLFST